MTMRKSKYELACEKHPQLASELLDFENWKPQLSRVSKYAHAPISTVFDFYKRFEKAIRDDMRR